MRDAEQHLGVIREKRPAWASRCEATNTSLRFLDSLSYIVKGDPSEKGVMPHFKCVRCKARLYSEAGPADSVGDLCPGCGSLLEPVGELAEIVGFRSIRVPPQCD